MVSRVVAGRGIEGSRDRGIERERERERQRVAGASAARVARALVRQPAFGVGGAEQPLMLLSAANKPPDARQLRELSERSFRASSVPPTAPPRASARRSRWRTSGRAADAKPVRDPPACCAPVMRVSPAGLARLTPSALGAAGGGGAGLCSHLLAAPARDPKVRAAPGAPGSAALARHLLLREPRGEWPSLPARSVRPPGRRP